MAKHEGGCHCGAVRYEAEVDTSSALECNCTHCSKVGALLAFVTPDKFTQTANGAQTEYLFHKKVIHYFFCAACGIQSFANGIDPKGNPMVALNLRTIDGIDLTKVTRQPFDGLHKL